MEALQRVLGPRGFGFGGSILLDFGLKVQNSEGRLGRDPRRLDERSSGIDQCSLHPHPYQPKPYLKPETKRNTKPKTPQSKANAANPNTTPHDYPKPKNPSTQSSINWVPRTLKP